MDYKAEIADVLSKTLAKPMDRAGVGASAVALMNLMQNRWGVLPMDQWTPEVRDAYNALSTLSRYLLSDSV